MRVNAARDAASVAGAPRRESLLALVGSLKEQGWSYEEAVSLLGVAAAAPDLHRPPDGDAPLDGARPPGRHRRWRSISLRRRRPRRAREPAGAGGAPLGDLRAAQRAPQRRGRSAGRPRLLADGPLVGGPAAGRGDRAGGRGALRPAADAAAAGRLPQLDRRRSRRQPQGAPRRDRLGAALRPRRGPAALRERARSPGARPLALRSAREAPGDAAPRDRRRAVGAGGSRARWPNEPFRCLCLGMGQKLRALLADDDRPEVPRGARPPRRSEDDHRAGSAASAWPARRPPRSGRWRCGRRSSGWIW